MKRELSNQQVVKIFESGESIYALSKKYKLNRATIRAIKRRQTYVESTNDSILSKREKKRGKLTYKQVLEIRYMHDNPQYYWSQGYKSKSEAAQKMFEISRIALHAVISGRTYGFVTDRFLEDKIVECQEALQFSQAIKNKNASK